MTADRRNSLYGPLDDVSGNAGYAAHPERVGFFRSEEHTSELQSL